MERKKNKRRLDGLEKKRSVPTLQSPKNKIVSSFTKKAIKKQARKIASPTKSAVYLPIETPSTIPTDKEETPNRQPPQILPEDNQFPYSYHRTWVILMAKDPHWIYATWEISAWDVQQAKENIPESLRGIRIVLRMYDVTHVVFDGRNANHYFDIEVGENTNNWYVNLWSDNVSYCAEIGLKTANGEFIVLARSNCVQTPRVGISDRMDQMWMTVQEPSTKGTGKKRLPFIVLKKRSLTPKTRKYRARYGRRIYLTEGDVRRYYSSLIPSLREIILSRLAKIAGKRLSQVNLLYDSKEEQEQYKAMAILPAKGYLTRMRIGSSAELVMVNQGGASEQLLKASELRLSVPGRKFFFEIGAELIVYGRTEPHAEVWLHDKQIPLRSDGTFTLRYALPDGKIPFDFTAVSNDKLEERKIETNVNRATTYKLPSHKIKA